MFFMATFTAYMLRTNISIAMIPMIKELNNTAVNGTEAEVPDVNIDNFN